jgi:myo-inositol-1(or 4)-monophosphatase
VAIEAVSRALELATSRVGAADVALKAGRDVVTATDIAVEDAVRTLLGEALGVAVVGEERGGDAASGRYWLIDPICGTRNFASGIPLYCVNLALVEEGAVTIAVVGDPSTGEVVVAEVGRGAWVLRDGSVQATRCSGASQTIVIEDSHASAERRSTAAEFVASVVRVDRWDLRSFSTTLSLAYVATGRVAAYVLFWTSAVHAAAGSLIAAESGAAVTDIDGRPWTVESDSLVASAEPRLHEELLALIKAAAA